MKKLSEDFPTIWHYTNEAGLYGILGKEGNQSIWATHYKFLNDYTEVFLFKRTLIELLKPEVVYYLNSVSKNNKHYQEIIEKNGGIELIAEHEVTTLVEGKYNALFEAIGAEIYVFSFCAVTDDYVKNNGLLSQWRGYGGDGGYAIEFDSVGLEKQLSQEGNDFNLSGVLGNCVYSDDSKVIEEELSVDLQIVAKYAVEVFEAVRCKLTPEVLEDSAAPALQSFINCITRFKHHAFKEEKEVRIAIALMDYLGEEDKLRKERRFRQRNGVLVPYIALFENAEKLPINKIIVGPHKEKEYRAEVLKVFLSNRGHKDIDVDVSNIPFV
ncbi:hypothetical protein A1359_01350 [Methylomonas lenta]|uniref:DUF2971 domain-containing protein n=1 Tax=Methylomonas lenta TaxID=980561 RepID=A0A177N4J6_9GAMM|nr:DUF2971 domain-containing protein [Methylomonas lenta]OAI12938.1 hypothetical protein A1359_01350 [Methylomonas lenta]